MEEVCPATVTFVTQPPKTHVCPVRGPAGGLKQEILRFGRACHLSPAATSALYLALLTVYLVLLTVN